MIRFDIQGYISYFSVSFMQIRNEYKLILYWLELCRTIPSSVSKFKHNIISVGNAFRQFLIISMLERKNRVMCKYLDPDLLMHTYAEIYNKS